MKEGFITEFFGLRKEQKENRRKILRALSLIVGSFFIAEGIISLLPETFEKGILIGFGLLLVIFSVLD